jgi:chromate transporter
MEAQGLSAGRWPQVFLAFLQLGLTSFGGPIAHIGYFREAFVSRRRWIDEQPFAELLALCQLLPGPSSSQMGMAIGFTRAGWKGALAAWIAFTLPSAALMVGFAWGLRWVDGGAGWLHGLKLAAVAVVAQAVLQMARQFAVGAPRLMMAVLAGLACAASGGAIVQPGVIVAGALLGPLAIRDARPLPAEEDRPVVGRRTGLALLLLCAALLVVVPLAGDLLASPALRQLGVYIRAGALVFGGGHVVLPLLEQGVTATGAADRNAFLAAYGAAQALPGPLFAIAAFPGWLGEPGGVAGAALATIAIFAPGALLLFGVLPFWSRIIALPRAAPVLAGANAAVVGLLAAALWDPLWRSSVHGTMDVAIAAAGFVALWFLRAPPLVVVAGCAAAASI